MLDIDSSIVNETDLAGPLVFILALGSLLLLSGKMHFGYIYGISIFAVLMMWSLLALMSPKQGPSYGTVASILGYSRDEVFDHQSFLSKLLTIQGLSSLF